MVERKKYGFIGNVADDTAALQGVFSLEDITNLTEDSNWGGKASVEFLCIGGGGGGGGSTASGGGAGGYRTGTVGFITGIEYTVTVGAGGNAGTGAGHGTTGGNGGFSRVAETTSGNILFNSTGGGGSAATGGSGGGSSRAGHSGG